MEFNHTSVLLNESINALHIKPNGIYVDGTMGGGGHSFEIAKRLDMGRLICIDQDIDAINEAKKRLIYYEKKVTIIKDNFANIKKVLRDLEIPKIDGILLDLGVSSYQLDAVERGFSYNNNAQLNMRMSQDNELDAKYIVNNYSKQELTKIISEYGEERYASKIAHFIEKQRKESPIETTGQLVEIIKMGIPAAARRTGGHPAKRTFQAIRIAVNNELGVLKEALKDSVDLLNKEGRLCVITFHSLEDRIVKSMFKEFSKGCTCPKSFPVCVCGNTPEMRILGAKGILPSEEEIAHNKRSRSARLRVAEKV